MSNWQPFTNINKKYGEHEQLIVTNAARVSHALAYWLSWKIIKPIGFNWSGNYKYIIFYASSFNTNHIKTEDAIPKGYRLSKIVISPSHVHDYKVNTDALHCEVHFEPIHEIAT